MNPFNIHWKHYILPTGIVLVSLWTVYWGAVSLFGPMERPTRDVGEARSSRSRFGENEVSGKSSRQQAARARGNAGKQASTKTFDLPVKKTDSGNLVAKSRVAQAGVPKVNAMVKPNGPQPVQVGGQQPRVLHGADPRTLLRESIIAEAFSLAMKSEKPWENLIAISKAQYSRGKKEAARDILLMAEKMAADPDDQAEASFAVREVVKVMLAQTQNDDALAALQNIQNSKERERAISEVAAWSARQGRVDLARNLIGQIVNAGARDVALVAIAESEAAYEGASVAMQTVSSIVSKIKKDDAYRRIALKRAGLNDFIRADQAVQYVQNDRLKNSTLTSLARQRVKNGDPNGGINTLQYVNDPLMADSALRELSADLAQLGQFSTSAYVTTRIRNEVEKAYAIALLSVEQAKSGDLSGSLVRTSSITVKSVRERALSSVSGVTAGNGEPERARNVAVRIDSTQQRNRAYRAIAQASAVDGNHVAAYNTLQEIDLPHEKALAMVSMARTRQKQGDSRQALSLLEDARRSANDVTSVPILDLILSDMAVAYAERRDSSHSMKLAGTIRNSKRRDTTFGSLARTLVHKYDLQSAQQSVESISSDKLRLKAEDDVARSFAQRVKPQNALKKSRALPSSRQRIIFLLEMSRKT